jgi:hypothetical protein
VHSLIRACHDRAISGDPGHQLRGEALVTPLLHNTDLLTLGRRAKTRAKIDLECRTVKLGERTYGASAALLPAYAWYQQSSADRARPGGGLVPNDLGLFDTLGNVVEWCQGDRFRIDPIAVAFRSMI